MKEYDIFLKRHLIEADLFIHSLPYRDGVSVANRVILEAMLKYYTLQRIIAVKNESTLVSEIDQIIDIVHEIVGSSVELRADAEISVRYYNELQNGAIGIGIPALHTFMQSFYTLENVLGICIPDIEAIAKSSLGDRVENPLSILVRNLETVTTSFARIESGIEIGAEIADSYKQTFEIVQNEVEIGIPSTDLFYCYTTGLETAMSLVAQITAMEIHFSLGNGSSELSIAASEVQANVQKYIDVSEQISIFCEMANTLISHFAGNNNTQINSSLSAGLKRYRLLNEVDDLALKDIDDMTLEELDYVELT